MGEKVSQGTKLGIAQEGAGLYTSWRNRELIREQNKLNTEEENRRRVQDREWALEDLESARHYNDPKQQMNRYRQAGLNPNLIYGKGADSTTMMARGVTSSSVNRPAPQNTYNPGQGIQTYLAVKQTQAMTDNVYQQIALAKAEEQLKQLSASNMAIKNAYDQNSLEQARKLNDSVILKANLENQYTQLKMDLDTFKNTREEVAQTKNLEMTTQQIITEQLKQKNLQLQNATLPLQKKYLQEQIDMLQTQEANAKKEGLIKDFEIKMNKAGISKDSPWYTKFLNHTLSGGNPLTLEEINEMKSRTGNAPVMPYKIPTKG
jgi:hypothetical protein